MSTSVDRSIGVKSYVINLERSPDRLARFRADNDFLGPVERFPAIDGRALNHAGLVAAGVIDARLAYSAGALGCALSHISLWETSLRTRDALTIFEDDAVVNRHFPRRSAAIIGGLPADWDCVLWGWNFDTVLALEFLPGVSPAVMKFDQVSLRDRLEDYPLLNFDVAVHRLACAFGIMAYSISPGGARKLLGASRPLRPFSLPLPGENRSVDNFGIDTVMSALYPQLRAFAVFPPLAVSPNRHETSLVQSAPERVRGVPPQDTE
jgi:GR25 family glycosyltransferase involved in LPS biosynthesis